MKRTSFDLQQILPHIISEATKWAQDQADHITKHGVPLSDHDIAIAKAVGVQKPELIRTLEFENFPLPPEGILREAAFHTGLLGPGTIGITFGHSIMLRSGHVSVRLLSHEFRHVYQYERAGSIAAFLTVYLQQIAVLGYPAAPLEIDARSHETS
jgi:hypothetical protein